MKRNNLKLFGTIAEITITFVGENILLSSHKEQVNYVSISAHTAIESTLDTLKCPTNNVLLLYLITWYFILYIILFCSKWYFIKSKVEVNKYGLQYELAMSKNRTCCCILTDNGTDWHWPQFLKVVCVTTFYIKKSVDQNDPIRNSVINYFM